MGMFKKKRDPISERAQDLNQQIAALEAQIKKLNEQPATPADSPFAAPAPAPVPAHAPPAQPRGALPHPAYAPTAASSPRLRSTALPRAFNVPHAAASEPIFEDVEQRRIHATDEPVAPPPAGDLGVRRGGLGAAWERLKNQFRTPPTSNPKLVSYLAAGSIQGLRPMRYEKRVARNRFIALVIVLAVVLWGIIAIIMKGR